MRGTEKIEEEREREKSKSEFAFICWITLQIFGKAETGSNHGPTLVSTAHILHLGQNQEPDSMQASCG